MCVRGSYTHTRTSTTTQLTCVWTHTWISNPSHACRHPNAAGAHHEHETCKPTSTNSNPNRCPGVAGITTQTAAYSCRQTVRAATAPSLGWDYHSKPGAFRSRPRVLWSERDIKRRVQQGRRPLLVGSGGGLAGTGCRSGTGPGAGAGTELVGGHAATGVGHQSALHVVPVAGVLLVPLHGELQARLP